MGVGKRVREKVGNGEVVGYPRTGVGDGGHQSRGVDLGAGVYCSVGTNTGVGVGV